MTEQASAGLGELRARRHDVLNGLNVVGAPLTESRLTGVMKARTLTTRPEIVVQPRRPSARRHAPGVAVPELARRLGRLSVPGASVRSCVGLLRSGRSRSRVQAGMPIGSAHLPPGAAVRGPAYSSQATVRGGHRLPRAG
jgi:hypothetical protein